MNTHISRCGCFALDHCCVWWTFVLWTKFLFQVCCSRSSLHIVHFIFNMIIMVVVIVYDMLWFCRWQWMLCQETEKEHCVPKAQLPVIQCTSSAYSMYLICCQIWLMLSSACCSQWHSYPQRYALCPCALTNLPWWMLFNGTVSVIYGDGYSLELLKTRFMW